MPMEPAMSSGLRPTRSTVAMATRVVTMFVTPVMTVMASELRSENPTACQRTLE